MNLFRFKHAFCEFFFDKHHFPVVSVSAQVRQSVVAIHIDKVKLRVACAEVHALEELVQLLVVYLLAVALDDEGM